jgi:RNA polymerase sigma-70 factor, ECF subfamily
MNAPEEQISVDGFSSDSSEAALVARLKAYDESAIRQVYRMYADAIYRYALYQCGDPTQAEDIAGDVFVRMMDSIESYTYRGASISAWLYRIARNLVVDHHRRNRRLQPLEPLEETFVASDNPAAAAEAQLTADEIRQLIGLLTEEQQQIILLKFVENLDNREISEIVGKTEGSVKSLQHRALRSLRRLMEQQGHHVGPA